MSAAESLPLFLTGLVFFFLGLDGVKASLKGLASRSMRRRARAAVSSPFRAAVLGVTFGALSQSATAVSFLLVWRDQPWFQVFNWLLGSFSGRTWVQVDVGWPYLAVSAVALWLASRPLDALAGGDAVAQSLGLAVRPARLGVIAAATLAVAVAVAVSGIIGFVGLIAPHAARRLFGAGHRRLLPASGLLGAILLVWADLGARTVLAPVEIPVGILTAVIGGPFFLVLLRRRGGRLA
jgi:iron complex transport system permease protein